MPRSLSTRQLRGQFLAFFEARGHLRVQSSDLVPQADPTLLFTSAGMVQFKPLFATRSPDELPYTRATSVQKCFRATDIEEVGHTPRHLTFFEMLGNFSFGDYFKREAIVWAWTFVTEVLAMEPERLWATVYLDDDEAAGLWESETGLLPGRVVRLGKKDNFWGPAGSTGACGPSSEIYWDLGSDVGCKRPECAPGCDCDRFQEFWNLVFVQFHMDEQGELHPLGRTGIDTGMGLERLAQIVQGKPTVFDTDGLLPLRHAALEILDPPEPDSLETRIALNVIVDHARAVTMLFSEGIYPSNEGRGYVARRILRRAMRRGRVLGMREPFMYRLAGDVIDVFGAAWPELRSARERVESICKNEEERFLQSLEFGTQRFDAVVDDLSERSERVICGADAFMLYDTYGFPIDLTREMAAERDLSVDVEGFEREMEAQRERSRSGARFGQQGQRYSADWEWLGDPAAPHSEYDGYDHLALEASIVARRRLGEEWELLLDRTPFYAESGGQVADHGWIQGQDFRLEVLDVQRHDDVHVHRGRMLEGSDPRGTVLAQVDAEARASTARNHTATHLLHAALKRVLGPHVAQAGSLVGPDRLRFDFNHPEPLTDDEIQSIEDDVNRVAFADRVVHKQVSSLEDARAAGAVAMFGERYGERVRQVFVSGDSGEDVSRELCGGCHLDRTGEIGVFLILSQESVGAGVRRVEAATGWNSIHHLRSRELAIDRLKERLRADSFPEIEQRISSILRENEQLKKALAAARAELLSGSSRSTLDRVEDVGGVRFLAVELPVDDVKGLREAADQLRQQLESGVGVLAARFEQKAGLCVFVTPDLVRGRRLDARRIVQELAPIMGGGGGGRPELATAGGKDPSSLDRVLARSRDVVAEALGADQERPTT